MTKINTITVKSPANIAFIKYWGQKDKTLTLPYHDNFAMNLSDCTTTVTIDVYDDPKKQEIKVKPYKQTDFSPAPESVTKSVTKFYQTVRDYLEMVDDIGYTVWVEHTFPHKAGIASSASFFSALALAFVSAFGQKLPEKELSILARLSGSGSAARSIPDGFTWWHMGSSDDKNGFSASSFAESMHPPDYWDLTDVVVITSQEEKKTGSQDGHGTAETSPFFADRLISVPDRLKEMEQAFEEKNFTRFGTLLEQEALSMHFVMMTQEEPLFFWSGKTVEVLKKVLDLRRQGTECYYTIDAGQNVHIMCEGKNTDTVASFFQEQSEVEEVIVNKPAVGARVIVDEE